MKRTFAIAAFTFVLALGGSAHAQDKNACIRALDRAQQLQGDLKLSAARAEYVTCTSTSCPAAIREDCARLLVDVENAMPSVVLAAVDEAGIDVGDVRASIDGAPPIALDGRATSLDPGTHVIRFEKKGEPPVSVNVVARQGEKNRRIAATFKKKPVEAPKAGEGELRRPAPIVPIILAGVGAVALGTALVMRLSIDSEVDRLRESCAPSCSAADRDALSSQLAVANVTFGVGLVALAAAATTWVLTAR